jgi:hypothetical protein
VLQLRVVLSCRSVEVARALTPSYCSSFDSSFGRQEGVVLVCTAHGCLLRRQLQQSLASLCGLVLPGVWSLGHVGEPYKAGCSSLDEIGRDKAAFCPAVSIACERCCSMIGRQAACSCRHLWLLQSHCLSRLAPAMVKDCLVSSCVCTYTMCFHTLLRRTHLSAELLSSSQCHPGFTVWLQSLPAEIIVLPLG